MSERLVRLRRLTPSDAPTRYGWEASPVVRDNVFPGAFETPRSRYLEAVLERLREPGERWLMFVFESRGGRPLGVVWLSNIDWENRSAQFGVIVGEEGRRGIGFGPAAVEALVELAFGDLNLHTVYNFVYATNEGMNRLVEGVEPDFVSEGDLNIGGRYVDSAMYALINGKRGLRW